MGSRIAAHLANAGVECLLLDVPAAGDTHRARNAIAEKAAKALLKSRPPALFTQSTLRHIETGNLQDDLPRIADADWVVEAVVENFDIKRELLRKVDEFRRPGSLVSSNTSGLPIGRLAEGLSDDFRRHWLGTHFFNPPRHMRLVEIIPTPETDPAAVTFVSDFCDRRLGKVVVYAKDRPNFIANRIFLFSVMHTIKTMLAQGLSVEEVDALTGPLIGRPRMATFRLADFTGIDVCLFVAETLHRLVPEDEKREIYEPPAFVRTMVERGLLGDKTGQGFYKKVRGPAGSDRLVLDLQTLDYRPPKTPSWPILEKAKKEKDIVARIRLLIDSPTPPGRFLWETLSELFLYTAARVPEVTDDILSVDTTMKAGFNWESGIFEIWSGLGVEQTVARMRKEGKNVPALVDDLLATPEKSFYHQKDVSITYFDVVHRRQRPWVDAAGVIRLSPLRRLKQVIYSNPGASLVNLGDGVVCLEFHSKANSLDEGVLVLLAGLLDDGNGEHRALVIGNEGKNFCVGANLSMLLAWCREGRWQEVEKAVGETQRLFRSLRGSRRPTVAAVFGQTLAGGCELAMHCHRVQAAAETYMGLVEVGAGLIPAAGGCTELLRRHTSGLSPQQDLTPATREAFETIGMAKVSNSAAEARERRFLQATDRITMNRDRLIADARHTALALVSAGYEPEPPADVLVGGEVVRAALELDLYLTHEAGWISGYDLEIGRKLANVLSGGPLSQPAWVSEDYLLGLEREAFLSLCGEEKTQQRMEHILKTGKPLRN
jgi:3-hydroxyacyl-CoA dehydrogenase